ncbi:branched-chain amino acid ABC transporter permease [Chloroflexota bacterium]
MRKYNLSRPLLGLGIALLLMLVLPLYLPEQYVGMLTVLLINAMLVVSFRFISTIGEWSLAHVPFMGVGSYTTALLTTELGWPFWLSLPAASLAAAAFALILSFPLFRMKAMSFFLGSFAAGEVLRLCWARFKTPFGGYDGIAGFPYPVLFAVDFRNIFAYYVLTLLIVLISLVVMYRLENSRIGSTFKAIAMNDSLVQSIGVNIRRYKTLAFVTGSFFAGTAGVLLAHYLTAVTPALFGIPYSLNMIVWSVVGGLSSFSGPLIGLIILTIVNEVLHRIGVEVWIPFIFSFILLVTLLFMPRGLVSLPQILHRIGKQVGYTLKIVKK